MHMQDLVVLHKNELFSMHLMAGNYFENLNTSGTQFWCYFYPRKALFSNV